MTMNWPRSLQSLALVTSAALVVAPVQPALAALSQTGTIHAAVTLAGTNELLSGVEVRVVEVDRAEQVAAATSDEGGKIVFADLPFGVYHVTPVLPEGMIALATPLVTVADGAIESAVAIRVGLPGVFQEEDSANAARGTVESVLGNRITLSSGTIVLVDTAVWTGDVASTDAIRGALDAGDNVCVVYEGTDGPELFTATSIRAFVCDDATAEAFASSGERGRTGLLIAAILGAAALGIGIAAVTTGPGDVITQ